MKRKEKPSKDKKGICVVKTYLAQVDNEKIAEKILKEVQFNRACRGEDK